MPVTGVKQDVYILGQSQTKSIVGLGEEIRLDLGLVPNPNLNAGTIIGTIKDSEGNPIEGALIKIMSSSHEPLAHTFSGADGSYIFTPFPPGVDYHIYAIKKGYKLEENIPFTLLKKQQITKNFTLLPNPDASLAIIAGDVINANTKAVIKGAAVNLYKVDELGVETLVGLSFTNDYGQFVFSELELGNYIVRISALGYKPYSTTISLTEPGQIGNVVPAIEVDPNVSRGTVSGIITDNNNLSIAGADVTLYKVEQNESLTPIAFMKTNDEGVYLFINVPQGSYKIKANKIFMDAQV